MRFTFVILLFLSLGANAQMIIKAHANYRPYAVAATNLLLDDYPNAAAAYSLRKLDKDYTGSAIRVRRSSDNAEQDIGFTSSGDLDTGALKTFVGANSGFVTTWYDQSGNARNATQTTAANQPRIVNAGTVERQDTKPSVRFISTSNNFLSMTTMSSNINFSIYIIQKRTSTSDRGIMFGSSNINGGELIAQWNDNNFYLQFNKSGQYVYQFASDNTTGLNLLSAYNNAGTTTAYRNNTQYSLSSQINFPASGANGFNIIGGYGIGNNFWSNGFAFEIIYYQIDQSSNRTGIQNNINTYYSIY